jgi:hypothetical protein
MQSMLEQAMYWPTGTSSIPEYLEWGRRFTLIGLENQISCPVLAVCGEGEGARSLEQAQAFCSALRAPWEFVRLPAEFGADSHCGVNNSVHTSAMVYDWIVKTFGVDVARVRASTAAPRVQASRARA